MSKNVYYDMKVSKDSIIHTINFMIHEWYTFKDHIFLGFIECHDDVKIGVELNNVWYAGGHVFYCDVDYDDWQNDKEECKSKSYVLMFGGSGNLSYFKRFENKMDAIEYFNKLDCLSLNIVKNCYRFN